MRKFLIGEVCEVSLFIFGVACKVQVSKTIYKKLSKLGLKAHQKCDI